MFNTELSLATIHGHVDTANPFDEIRLRLFSHGVEPVACRPSVMALSPPAGGKAGSFLGVDEQVFSREFATLARYDQAIARVRNRYLCRIRSRSRGSTSSWIGRECYAGDRKDSCAASAGAGPMRVVLGPGRARTRMQLPRPRWPDCGRSG